MKKDVQRKFGFVLFVMAVFFAGISLLVWRNVIVLCIAGVILFATAVFYVMGQEDKDPTPTEKTTEILLADRMAELMRGNEKAEKGVYIAVKKQHEAMESGLTAINEKLEELIKAQENAVKTIVMYNKENAKQMALSEKEELGQLRKAWGGGSLAAVTDAIREMSHRLYTEMHETGEAMLSELETTADGLDEMRDVLKKLGTGRPDVAPDVDEDVPEEVASEDVWQDEVPEEEEEAVEEKESEDAVAPPDIDLSDPNRTLSAEDIAALVASMGH